jgi:hypothetical protein
MTAPAQEGVRSRTLLWAGVALAVLSLLGIVVAAIWAVIELAS